MKRKIGIFFILTSSILAGVGQLFWKQASTAQYDFVWRYLIDLHFLAGGFFYFVATLTMMISFRYAEYSLLLPMLSFSYIWVAFLSLLLFEDETFQWSWTFGVFFIILGIGLLSRSKNE